MFGFKIVIGYKGSLKNNKKIANSLMNFCSVVIFCYGIFLKFFIYKKIAIIAKTK